MTEYELSDEAEEILARLWVAREEQDEPSCPTSTVESDDGGTAAVAELLEAGMIDQKGEVISLTASGAKEAESVIRRERLAERLLTDVLDLGEVEAAEAACQFEHVLHKGVADQICTLLGHPKVCPHGNPIPPGECCAAGTDTAGQVVSRLAELVPGQRGVIAYIHGARREMIQRMLAMGAVPGTPITLVQRTPSYVFQVGQAQIAVDRETARDIYVRLTGQRSARPPTRPFFGVPLGGLRFRRGRHRR
ncbi:MAG: metal-dependent transcriptional regulator [Armatimonadetes bacterium]|nr:metal-dependent transcriptional regulator [Armatimonadota bacterium]